MSAANAVDIERAVIFIHGFNGSAKGTWADFAGLVDDKNTSRWWETADLYFFHYQWNSMFESIPKNTNTVIQFIEHLFPTPPDDIFNTAGMGLRDNFSYKKLSLIGHSEGGLILRKVILEIADADTRLEEYLRERLVKPMTEPSPQGIELADIRLFAPAIGGESITGFFGLLTHSSVIAPTLRLSAAKVGMNSTSSSVTEARASTRRYADNCTMACFRAHILWADKDTIVNSERYQRDYQCKNLPTGTDHVKVCKPNPKYIRPLTFVEFGVVNGKC